MTNTFQITEGTKVHGLYHNTPYTGTVIEARVDQAAFQYLFTVQLDSPINCYSKIRDRIHFCANDFVTVEAMEKPKTNVHAYILNRGRAFVEAINTKENTAIVRFDPNTGTRSRCHTVGLDQIDFSREWKF